MCLQAQLTDCYANQNNKETTKFEQNSTKLDKTEQKVNTDQHLPCHARHSSTILIWYFYDISVFWGIDRPIERKTPEWTSFSAFVCSTFIFTLSFLGIISRISFL